MDHVQNQRLGGFTSPGRIFAGEPVKAYANEMPTTSPKDVTSIEEAVARAGELVECLATYASDLHDLADRLEAILVGVMPEKPRNVAASPPVGGSVIGRLGAAKDHAHDIAQAINRLRRLV